MWTGRDCSAFALQKVQKQLKQSETAAKDDASPVTVADYGMAALDTHWQILSSSFAVDQLALYVLMGAANDIYASAIPHQHRKLVGIVQTGQTSQLLEMHLKTPGKPCLAVAVSRNL